MATAADVWGIDVGRCAFKAIKLRPGAEGRVDLVGQEYFEHATMISDSEGNQFQLMTEALERFLSKHDISKDKIVVGVPGQHTLARFSKLPPVEPKKIPDIVRYEADQQIPFDLDEVIWDFQTFQEEDAPDVEVGIFAIKRDLIRDFLLPFEHAGIEPVAVQASPLALYNALQFDERLDQAASVLLDIGAENTTLIVATVSGLWTRTIPLGGNRFTDALVKAFKLTFAKAENLKRTAASSKYARQVFQAMRSVFAEFVQELSRSLGFYRTTHRDAELKRVIGLGSAFKLPGLQKYLQQNLQMPVEKPETFKKVNIASAGEDSAFIEQLPSFVVSYGLALQGLDIAKALPSSKLIQSNLLPTEIVKQVIWRKKRPFFAAAAACLLLASGIVWFRRQSDLSILAANAGQPVKKKSYAEAVHLLRGGVSNLPPREEGETWLEVAKALQAEMKQYKGEGTAEIEKSEAILKLQENKAVWPKILAMIHDALPKPEGALAAAEDAAEYSRLVREDRTGALARSKRREVFIEHLSAEYKEDLSKVDLSDVVTAAPTPLVEASDKTKKLSGFLVTLQCRTPHEKQYQFVAEAFKDAIKTSGQQPKMGFFVNRVVITRGGNFREKDDAKGPSGRNRRDRRRSRRPSKKTHPVAGVKTYDPVTDEPMDNDWVFEMKLDVVLRDAPEKKKDETA